ncbi:hypothetical protein B0H34DRAFT_256334 [Crassisporium funariophilum]|nr:hypothetical protein B0H34DRAFT_256334 [Crassisporium funariophilum]
MHTADGYIKATSSKRMRCAFKINEVTYTFTGDLAWGVENCSCTKATLTYTSLDQLSATMRFEAHLGGNSLELNLDNGPFILGVLSHPIYPFTNTVGSGDWRQNMVPIEAPAGVESASAARNS